MSLFTGKSISISIFGQSHSPAIGAAIDGLPAGIPIDQDYIRDFLKRRAPSSASFSTQREEADIPEFIGGVLNGRTTGASVCAIIPNEDTRPEDYSPYRNTPRPGHADLSARMKYAGLEDSRGGGAFSGRMTAPLCIAGAIALSFLREKGITVGSHLLCAGSAPDSPFPSVDLTSSLLLAPGKKGFPVIDDRAGERMLAEIARAKACGDSVGGVIEAAAIGLPWGLGGELFDGLEAKIARLIFSIPAVKGMELGAGFEAAKMLGSQNNDEFFYAPDGSVKTRTNNHGGLLGGITTSMPLIMRAAFKPTPSIGRVQRTVDLAARRDTEITISGRHDACIAPRALPAAESCLGIAIMDEML